MYGHIVTWDDWHNEELDDSARVRFALRGWRVLETGPGGGTWVSPVLPSGPELDATLHMLKVFEIRSAKCIAVDLEAIDPTLLLDVNDPSRVIRKD